LKTSGIDEKKTCMAKCGTVSEQQGEAPLSYSLKTLCSRSVPKNLKELNAWLTVQGEHPDWDGKLYVASTIWWSPTANEFQQTGCSPNYHAGWWSLACCKHDMRTARPFRHNAIDLSIPTYVFTLGKLNPDLGQPLVSVARVTKYSFETMHDYAEFLRTKGDQKLMSSRLTREFKNDGQLGWRFGDCHADSSGNVGAPSLGHVHRRNRGWYDDVNGEHIILASDEYLLWREPVFVAAITQKQSRYGQDINAKNLERLITVWAA
jgi:hypothetical protein